MENNNDKKIKIYVTLLITVICIIGVSYAYFRLVLSQSDNNSLASRTCFSITLTEQTSKIALTDVYPVTDEEGIKGTPYTFTIKNNCTGYVKATITIDSEYRTQISTTYLKDDYVKVNLSKSDVLTQSNMHLGNQELVDLDNSRKGYKLLEIKMGPKQEFTYDLRIWLDADTNIEQGLNKKWEGKIVVATVAIKDPATPNGWNEAADGTLLAAIRRDNKLRETLTPPGAATSYSINDTFPSFVFNANAYYTYGDTYKVNADGTYTIENPKKVKYSEGLSTLKGKYMVSSAYDYSDVKSTTDELLETTNKKQLLLIRETSADRFTYSKISGGMKTFPEETEAVMASTADDYGTSYYFRGAVENNYVEFANKCWRIVRVTGDGSIKLALFNNNTEGNTNPCAEANDSGDAAIIGESKFNYAYGDNAFVGLMYGNVGCSNGTSANQNACTSARGTWTASASYANAHANINKSTILKYLEEWYDNNIANYDSYIADTIWCNDKSTVNDTSFNPFGSTLGTNYGYGLNVNYYGTTQRIIDAEAVIPLGDSPSLICPNDNLGGKLSKYTVNDKINGNGDLDKKVGLLTADEIVYAGGGNVNFSYYLLKNTENTWWWALSPFDFSGFGAIVWVVDGNDSVLDGGDVYYDGGGRPSLSLKSTVPIASGKGTRTSPYVVE
ncbi:MAG: hypothetical protein Q4C44_02215 [bacterium]|nr:hypothetical protein [bacterium]